MHNIFHAQNYKSGGVIIPTTYGRMYNHYAAGNSNFAPTGWRVPTKADYETLVTNCGGVDNAGGVLKIGGTEFWSQEQVTTPNGFNGVGGGIRSTNLGQFSSMRAKSYFHTSDGVDNDIRYLSLTATYLKVEKYWFFAAGLVLGAYVRLVRDTAATSVTDYDGNEYGVVQIGSQYWVNQNWKCTHLDDGTLINNITDDTEWYTTTSMGQCAYDNDESYV